MNVPNTLIEFVQWLAGLSDIDIGRYASGGYGVESRVIFCAMILKVAKGTLK